MNAVIEHYKLPIKTHIIWSGDVSVEAHRAKSEAWRSSKNEDRAAVRVGNLKFEDNASIFAPYQHDFLCLSGANLVFVPH